VQYLLNTVHAIMVDVQNTVCVVIVMDVYDVVGNDLLSRR